MDAREMARMVARIIDGMAPKSRAVRNRSLKLIASSVEVVGVDGSVTVFVGTSIQARYDQGVLYNQPGRTYG